MPGPYDYTINIPQPPANNFLQSLLGIQQLKGLQQQSQIAAQQAAIQQQQARFAQEQHPLEMARIQAGINASNASAGESGARTGLIGVNTEAAKLGLEENRRKNQDLAAYQSEALKLAEDPTSWDANKLKSLSMKAAALDPQSFTAMNNLFQHLPQTQNLLSNAASEVILSVNSGKPEIAKSSLDKYIGAAQFALDKNPEDKSAQASLTFLNGAKKTLEVDPTGGNAALQASNFLFNTDPAKWDQTTKALKAGGDIAKTQAETLSLGQQKKIDEEKRALDLQKERLQIQELEQKLNQARNEQIKTFASTNKYAKELSDASLKNQQTAEAANGILAKIDSGEIVLPTGAFQKGIQNLRDRFPDFANDISMLRTEYQKMANSEVMKSLPPGSASDADRKFAQEGVMAKNATPEQFRKGVEAMARLSEYASKYNEAKLAWVSQNNGSAGNSLKEFDVFGSPIKKGSAFHAWWNKVGNTLDPNGTAPAGGSTDRITNTPDITSGQRRQQPGFPLPSSGGAADFGLFNINGEEVRVTPKGK